MNYLGPPEKMEKGVSYTQLFLDFGECRAILPEGPDATVTFTTLEDMAKTVAKAVDYKGEWPVMGGIVGNRITISGLLQLGERIRGISRLFRRCINVLRANDLFAGKKFTIEKVKMEDLKVNDYVTSWNPITLHPSIPEEQREIAGREFARLSLIGLPDGGWDVSDDWSKLLPDQKFVTLENFLQDSWGSV